MKKFFTMIAIAMALPLAFSCNQGANNATSDNGQGQYQAKQDDAQNFQGNGFNVSLNGFGKYSGTARADLTKGSDEVVFVCGNYTIEADGTIKLEGLGAIKAEGNKVSFIPAIEAADPIELNVTPAPKSGDADIFIRNWQVEGVIVTIGGANKTFQGLDLNAIEAFAKDNGINFKTTFKQGMKAKSVSIFDQFIGIAFENGENYGAAYQMPKSGNQFQIDELSDLDVEILNGDVVYQIAAGKLILTIKAKVQEQNSSAVVTLSPIIA